MDERIEKILRTDADARKRIAKARQNAEEVLQGVSEEIEKLKTQFEKKAENKTKEIKKEQQKTVALFEEKKREENEQISQRLDEISKDNFDKWVETIYERTISEN